MPGGRILSTSEERRDAVVEAAVSVFAERGYAGSTLAAVAERADISPAYVSKLFHSKVALFVAALDACYTRIVAALERGAAAAGEGSPEEVLHAMGGTYADLIADRDLLMLQVRAQATTDLPEVASAVRRGTAAIVTCAAERSGAPSAEVQRFVAFGQLCHLVTTLDAFDSDEEWARLLTAGVRHAPARRTTG